jgi:hypothetical protein
MLIQSFALFTASPAVPNVLRSGIQRNGHIKLLAVTAASSASPPGRNCNSSKGHLHSNSHIFAHTCSNESAIANDCRAIAVGAHMTQNSEALVRAQGFSIRGFVTTLIGRRVRRFNSHRKISMIRQAALSRIIK